MTLAGLRATPATAIIEQIAAASVEGFHADLRAIQEPRPHWISLAEMALPPGRATRHRRIERAVGAGAPARLAPAWEVEAVAWFLGVMVGGALLLGPALPSPRPERVWARIGPDGLAEGLAIDAESRCVLPARPGEGRAAILAMLGSLVESLGARSSRVLWWHAGDRIADAVLWSGQAFGAGEAALRIAEGLLAPGVPYAVPLGIEGAGAARRRRTCCLARRTLDGATCEDCPHREARH